MQENIENENSLNENEEVVEVETTENDDPTVLKEQLTKLQESNKRLFSRAKKAEGFELKDGKWIKPQKEEKPVEKPIEKPEAKSSELDYGQKAFLRSYDIKGADELNLVKNWANRTGDELDVIVEDEIFQSKLKSLREAKATANAIPKGTKRSNQVSTDDVQVWIEKIKTGQAQIGDIEDIDMRRKVLNKRVDQERRADRFSPNSVIMG